MFIVVLQLKRNQWLRVGTLALITGAVLAALLLFVSSPFPPVRCDQEVIREFPSPRGGQKAVVMRINCHATTPFVIAVALVRTGERIDLDKHTIFSVKGDDDMAVLWNDGGIVIEHHKPDRIYRKAVVWESQPISYIERAR